MSTATAKRKFDAALADAMAFRDLFPKECYDEWKICGSLRRRQPIVSDIDHVVIPRFGEMTVGGSLFEQKEIVNLVWYQLDAMVAARDVDKHLYGDQLKWGDKLRGFDFRAMQHE